MSRRGVSHCAATLLLEVALDLAQRLLEILAAHGTNVLGSRLLGLGRENIDELTCDGFDPNHVIVVFREREALVLGRHHLNHGVGLEAHRVERRRLCRRINGVAGVILHGIGNVLDTGTTTVSMSNDGAIAEAGRLIRVLTP